MEDIDDADYAHAKTVCKDFEIKINNLQEYYDFYVQTNTLLLADVFENFRKIWLENIQTWSCKIFSAPRLPWQAALKEAKKNYIFQLISICY